MRANVEDIYGLSPLQQGMLFHLLEAPSSGLYFEQLVCGLEGDLDAALFERAWQRVVERHSMLRTCFVWQGVREPVQVVQRRIELRLDLQDWSPLAREERERRLEAFLAEDLAQGVLLSRAPLMRLALMRTSAAAHLFVWSYPHLLLDGWSLPIVLEEVFGIYEALRRGEEPALPPARPFREYIAWLNRRDPVAAESFWRRSLAGLEGPTRLTPDAAAERGPMRSIEIHLASEATAALQALARRAQVTLNTLVQAAFAVLLSRYSGDEKVVYGTTVSGRPAELPGVERMVGLFINTVPVRVHVPEEEGLPAWLGKLQQQQSELLLYGYTSLLDVRRWSGMPGSQSLFEALLVFENYPIPTGGGEERGPGGRIALAGARIEERTNYPLTLGVAPGPRLMLIASHDAHRFDEAAIRRLLAHLENLLQALGDGRCSTVAELPLLAEGERHQLLAEWNDRAGTIPGEQPVHRRFESWVRRCPDAAAVICGRDRLSYAELNERANRLAHLLRTLGVGPEVLVGICLEGSPEAAVAVLGVLKAGGAYLPLDPSYPEERLAFMLGDSGAAVLLTRMELSSRLPASGARTVVIDSPETRALLARQPEGDFEAGEGPENLSYVIYTSGSTGLPKGALLSHRGLRNMTDVFGGTLAVAGPGDRILQFAPLSFDASVSEIFMALGNGATLVFAPPSTLLAGRELLRELRERKISTVTLPPSSLAVLPPDPLPDLRALIVAGEACAPDLVARWAPGRRFFNAYGPTEATVCSTTALCRAGGGKPPIGAPIDHVRVHLVDPHLQPVPVGVPGELLIAGRSLSRGYLGRPHLTAERFIPCPWSETPGERMFRTGDLARRLPSGALDFLGRIDQQVKIRGFRIEPGEVEASLRSHPAVREAAVVASGTDRLVAYWVPEAGCEAVESDLRDHLKRLLPGHMVPGVLVRLGSLPVTPSGKLDRRALPSPDGARSVSRVEPRTELERGIAHIWREVLGIEAVGLDDNFFDLGGHSLLLIQVQGRLREDLGHEVSLVDLLRFSTVGALARHLGPEPVHRPEVARGLQQAEARRKALARPSASIAIIGLAGRFPGARNLDEFWCNLRDGVESISFFTEDELAAEGVDRSVLRDPAFVPASGVLAEAEQFDADFFGIRPREAEILDPQQRLFLECSWEALEDAGYEPARVDGPVGVFAGASLNHYGYRLYSHRELWSTVGSYQAALANNREFLTTRLSYKLGLRGPSVNVQTACSTSLVAVHMACQSLRAGECDMALAGGVSIDLPRKRGYLFQEGSIQSPDGHCRAFDARARGTVTGEGVGMIVLKRLEDALADGDTVRAVILGSAINNDGSLKAGYTAPSIEGQAEVIAEALAFAGVDPATISYVEAHGTGTPLGDPIEVAALTEALGRKDREPIGLGSVKSNIGHADAAAGIAGLIKTVLALEHGALPPSLHFESPNPEIDFARGGFYVNAALREWKRGGTPRRAGVSSFGIGGTNAHVVLEEAPLAEAAAAEARKRLLVLSARTPTALEAATDQLIDHLRRHPEADLGDVAHTLAAGRRAFAHRRVAVCRDGADAIEALGSRSADRVFTAAWEGGARRVAFLFPGQGEQRPNAGREAYEDEPLFRRQVDLCAELLEPRLGMDLRRVLFPEPPDEPEALRQLGRTELAQPALFVLEYALARLLMDWGLQPQAMLGHSVGEYVAACLAGVFPLETALGLIATRGRLLQELPGGGMLSVPLSEDELRPLLDEELALAAVNAPGRCVAAGPFAALEALERRLSARGITGRRLATSHAFHSAMVEPVLASFAEEVRKAGPRPPSLPFVSNVTGTWIRPEEAADPGYWARHLRSTVRFAEGIATLMEEPDRVLLDLGPGRALAGLARRQGPGWTVLTAEGRDGRVDPREVWGRVWSVGGEVDPETPWSGERRRRIPLPTYPFERRRYWIERLADREPLDRERRAPLEEWFHLPAWRPSPLAPAAGRKAPGRWLLLLDERGLGEELARSLEDGGAEVVLVESGEGFLRLGERRYALDPRQRDHFERLLQELADEGRLPQGIAHLGSLKPPAGDGARRFQQSQAAGLYSMLSLVQALARRAAGLPLEIVVVTEGAQSVHGGSARPENAPLLAVCRGIPQEYPNLVCRSIDLEPPGEPGWRAEEVARRLAADLAAPAAAEAAVAYRRGRRWAQGFEPLRLGRAEGVPARLRQGGTYLVTGGLGEIGLTLAEHLARTVGGSLVLTGRSPFPAREDWESWLAAQGEADPVSRKILRLKACEEAGAQLLVLRADAADEVQMGAVLAAARQRFGPLTGVFHAAGLTGLGSLRHVAETSPELCEMHFRAKVYGLYVLDKLLRESAEQGELEVLVLFSSLSSILGGIGYTAYAAANLFLDAFAGEWSRTTRCRCLSVGWDGWQRGEDREPSELISPAEGMEALDRLLWLDGEPHVIVSTGDLLSRMKRWVEPGTESPAARGVAASHPRPALQTPYEAPRGETEATLVGIWEEFLGIRGVGVHDDFFELGGDSLLATELMARLRQVFHLDLTLRSFLEAPTVAGLAAAMAPGRTAGGEEDEIERLLREIEGQAPEARDEPIGQIEGGMP